MWTHSLDPQTIGATESSVWGRFQPTGATPSRLSWGASFRTGVQVL